MVEVVSASDAVCRIKDDDTIIVGGTGGTGAAELVLTALEGRFLETGAPRGLTLFHITGMGDGTKKGLCHLAHAGLIRRVIGGHYGLQVPFMKLIRGNEIEAYNLPQGVLSQMCRAMAAKQPGVLTHVGIGTYIDPRLEGGRMNERTTEELVEVHTAAGKEWLFYSAPTPNVAIIRGTTADEDGYIAMEHEATTREDLSIAQAVYNAGGIVICQVKRLAGRGTLHPQMVKIPGFLVDLVVVDPAQAQTFGTVYDPSRSGETTAPLASIVPDPLSVRRVIARRAAMELRFGDVVCLGVGVSALIPNITAEEGISDRITLTVETGTIGGIPGNAAEFGTAVNPRAIVDQPYQFDFFDGGGLDSAFLSFAEVDAEGNVNVSRFGDRYDGCGGFINISQCAKRLVFSGTLTGGRPELRVRDGALAIDRDGDVVKFVEKVGQVSFSGRLARDTGQTVVFVTERAVFQLAEDGLVLTEIAPGVRLEEDILDRMAFRPRVAKGLRSMDERLFREGPVGMLRDLGDCR